MSLSNLGIQFPSEAQIEPKLAVIKSREDVSFALRTLAEELPASLRYHNLEHTEDVLHEAVLFSLAEERSEEDIVAIALAAAFHDIGFTKSRKRHESHSAEIAEDYLRGRGDLSAENIDTICQMILDTRLCLNGDGPIQKSTTGLSAYLLDADVSNFGRNDFFEKFELSRAENDSELEPYRVKTLGLMKRHQWLTKAARELRSEQKDANVQELERLIAEET